MEPNNNLQSQTSTPATEQEVNEAIDATMHEVRIPRIQKLIEALAFEQKHQEILIQLAEERRDKARGLLEEAEEALQTEEWIMEQLEAADAALNDLNEALNDDVS